MVKHQILLQKESARKLNHVKIYEQVKKIVGRAVAGSRRSRGWSAKIEGGIGVSEQKGRYLYKANLLIVCHPKTSRSEETLSREFDNILKIITAAGNVPKWIIAAVDEKPVEKTLTAEGVSRTLGYVPVEIPSNWQEYFEHIYNREDQIELIISNIQAAIDSDWRNRFHAALVGEPASGKTEIARSFKAMLGEAAVLEYDATSTTMAGAIKDLDSRDELPRILVLEEAEKAVNENELKWLLSVLDHRAEIRKVNFRTNIQRETRMLCIATVNDYDALERLMAGALASRLGEPIWCPQPDRELLRKILEREVGLAEGNVAWIEPTLDYAEEFQITDPRSVTSICLRGKNQLLDGSYQGKLRRTRIPVKGASNFDVVRLPARS